MFIVEQIIQLLSEFEDNSNFVGPENWSVARSRGLMFFGPEKAEGNRSVLGFNKTAVSERQIYN